MGKPAVLLEKYALWVKGLAIVGIGLALYLYFEYLTKNTYGVCNINAVINCGPITTGSLSELFGVSVALIGLVGYTAILLTAIFKQFKWAFGMAAFGMLFCLRLTILEIFVEHVLCPVCVACQIIMLIEFFLTYRLAYPKKASQSVL